MILFMGVPGSGKSMQGRKLADNLALPWLSTGEFLRMLIAGDQRKDMLAGRLLDDEDMIALVQKIFAVIDARGEFVLDGFPRTEGQADWLMSQVKYGQLTVTAVVHLQATLETVKERLLSRGRQDDTEAAISERFKEYEASIRPILERFRADNVRVIDVDAGRKPDEIHAEIKAALAGQA